MNTELNRYPEFGYVVVPGVFSAGEIRKWRESVEQYREHGGDLLSHPVLFPLVADSRLVEIARSLNINPVLYYGDSSVSYDLGGYGFHRDNCDREDPNAPDWQIQDYPLLRMAIYLQDYSEFGGGLEVVPGSHQYNYDHSVSKEYLATRIGDLVVWNLRLFHSGHGGGERPTQPLPRIALFITYGRPHPLTDRYVEYLKTRAYQVEMWCQSSYSSLAIDNSIRHGLELRDMRREVVGHPELGHNVNHVPLSY